MSNTKHMSDGELIARVITNCMAMLVAMVLPDRKGAERIISAGMKDGDLIEAELARREAERRGS